MELEKYGKLGRFQRPGRVQTGSQQVGNTKLLSQPQPKELDLTGIQGLSLSLNPSQVQIPPKRHNPQTEYLMKESTTLQQMVRVINKLCFNRSITVLDYFHLAPKCVFAKVFHKLAKSHNYRLGSLQLHLQRIFIFTRKLRVTNDSIQQLPLQAQLIEIVTWSLFDILKYGKFDPSLMQRLENHLNGTCRQTSYFKVSVGDSRQPIPQSLNVYLDKNTVRNDELELLLEVIADDLLALYLNKDYQLFTQKLQEVLSPNNLPIVKLLIDHKRTFGEQSHVIVDSYDYFLLKMINGSNAIIRARGLINLLSLLFNDPEKDSQVQTHYYGNIIDSVLGRVLAWGMGQELTLFLILARFKSIVEVGKILDLDRQHVVNDKLLSVFLDGLYASMDLLRAEAPASKSWLRLQIQKMAVQAVEVLVVYKKVFRNEFYLRGGIFPTLECQVVQKFASPKQRQLFGQDNPDVCRRLLGILLDQKLPYKYNIHKVYLVIKRLKQCIRFSQVSPELATLIQQSMVTITLHLKKVQLVGSLCFFASKPNKTVVSIYQTILGILAWQGKVNTRQFFGGDFILKDAISVAQKVKGINNQNMMTQFIRDYLVQHQYCLNLSEIIRSSTIHNDISSNISSPVEQDKDGVESENKDHPDLQKFCLTKFFKSIKADSNTPYVKALFGLVNERISQSYFSIIAIPLFLYRIIGKTADSPSIAAEINRVFRVYIIRQDITMFEALGFLNSMEILHSWIIINQDRRKATAFRSLFDHLDYNLMSLCFQLYGYPKHALFYLEKSAKWTPHQGHNIDVVYRAYTLTKAIQPRSLALPLSQILSYLEIPDATSFYGVEEVKEQQQLMQQSIRIASNCLQAFTLSNERDSRIQTLHIKNEMREILTPVVLKLNSLSCNQQIQGTFQTLKFSSVLWHFVETARRFFTGPQTPSLPMLFEGYFSQDRGQLLQNALLAIKDYLGYSEVEQKTKLLQQVNHFNSRILLNNSHRYRQVVEFAQSIAKQLFEVYCQSKNYHQAQKILNLQSMDQAGLKIRLYHQMNNQSSVSSEFSKMRIDPNIHASKLIEPLDLYLAPSFTLSMSPGQIDKVIETISKINPSWLQSDSNPDTSKSMYHMCNVFNHLYLYGNLSSNHSASLLCIITQWIKFANQQQLYDQGILLTAICIRMSILHVKSQVGRDKGPQKSRSLLAYNQLTRLVGKVDSSFFLANINSLVEEISFQDNNMSEYIQGLLTAIAKQLPSESVWWIMLLSNFTYGKVKGQTSDLWNVSDQLKQKIGKSILGKVQAKINKNTILFIQSIYSMFQSVVRIGQQENRKKVVPKPQIVFERQLKKVNKNTNFSQVVEVPFIRPIRVARLGYINKLGSSKCLTRNLEVFLEDDTKKSIILKAQFKPANKCNQSKVSDLLNNILPPKLNISYKIIRLSKYFVMVEFLQNYQTVLECIQSRDTKQNLAFKQHAFQIQRNGGQQGIPNTKGFWELYYNLEPSLPKVITQKLSVEQWWIYRVNYNRTTALWSMACYALGVGDRHCQNIMVNSNNGKVAHIDFEYSLDTGKMFNCPQFMSFRLTTNFQAALGPLGAYGTFLKHCIRQVGVLASNKLWITNSVFSLKLGRVQSVRKVIQVIYHRLNLSSEVPVLKMVTDRIQQARCPIPYSRMFRGWAAYL